MSRARAGVFMRSAAAIASVLVSAVACRDSDEPCSADEHEDMSGTWELATVVTSHCEDDQVGAEDRETATVEQQNDEITVDVSGFLLVSELRGSICGASFSARDSESAELLDCSGTESVTVSGEVDGDAVSGSIHWSQQVDDPETCLGITSCSGSLSYTGERIR